MDKQQLLEMISATIVMVLSLSVHECAHAAVAWWLGDDTAERQGRLTLDPRSHVDPIGTLLMPAIGSLSGIPLIGWARPVPTQPRLYTRQFFGKRISMGTGSMLVSMAGPGSNLVLAVLATVVLGLSQRFGVVDEAAYRMVVMFIIMNVGLCIFNLIPIPPLDGSHVLMELLPRHLQPSYASLAGIPGFILLMLLINTNVLGTLAAPAYVAVARLASLVAGV